VKADLSAAAIGWQVFVVFTVNHFLKGVFMKKETVNQQETLNPRNRAFQQIAEALRQLTEGAGCDCAQQVSEQMLQMQHQLQQIETRQQQCLYQLEAVAQQSKQLGSIHEVVDKVTKTNHLLTTEHVDEHVLKPMLQFGFSIYDLLEDARQHRTILNQSAQKLIDALRSQLQQWLDNNAIQTLCSAINTPFESKTMKPLVRSPIADRQLDGLVAESLQAGFQCEEGKVLRPEAVSLYTYEPSPTDLVISTERADQ
jgi:hypothetical protein